MPAPIRKPKKNDLAQALGRLLVDHIHEYIEGVALIVVEHNVVSFEAGGTQFTLTVSIPRRAGSTTPGEGETP